MINGSSMPSMQVLTKSPDNFTIEWVNNTGGSGIINGSMIPGSQAYFTNGQIILNISNHSVDETMTIKLMLGLQDTTCIDQMLAASNNQWNETKFREYCVPNMAPPKFESSPVYVNNQTVIGFNPFAHNLDQAPDLNTSGTTTFVLNISNPLLNYTGNNIFVEYQFPINVTIFHNNSNLSDNTTVSMSETHKIGFYNSSDNLWYTINATTDPNIIESEGCLSNMTDQMPGSPMHGKNMTMCFKSFIVNLSQSAISGDGIWSYGDSAKLNISMTNSFKALNKSTAVIGGGSSLGDRGNTSWYNFTFAGQNGVFKINTTILPRITGSAGESACRVNQGPSATGGQCDNVSVYVNGQLYNNWTTGSLIITSQEKGVQSISVRYTVPAVSAAAAAQQQGQGGTGGTGTVTESETVTVDSISTGEIGIFNFTKSVFGVNEIDVKAKSDITNAQLIMRSYSALPSALSVEPIETDKGSTYKYLQISTLGGLTNSKIDKATIKFKVTKNWINNNNIDEDKVYMKKYAGNNVWTKLTTTKTSSDSVYAYYEAETTGFSYFAIVGEKLEETTTIPAEETTTNQTTTGKEEETKKTSTWKIVLLVIILIAVVGGIIYYYKFYSAPVKYVYKRK